MLLNYHIGRCILGSLCVADSVRLGWSGVRIAGWSLQHGHHSNPAAPNLQHNHSQHNQCRTPYAVIHGLVLLMMSIMMPETCWDRSLIINIGLVASCWFISLHPTFHDARSQQPKTHCPFTVLCRSHPKVQRSFVPLKYATYCNKYKTTT